MASVTTPAGVTTSYAYWPDRTRRTATTTAGGVAHVITYHYATAGADRQRHLRRRRPGRSPPPT